MKQEGGAVMGGNSIVIMRWDGDSNLNWFEIP